MTPVTKPYLPDINKLKSYIDEIYKSGHLTNSGPLLKKLEARLADYLGVKHVICVANGSLALQVAYKALELEGEVITTPFSFAATTSTLQWEKLTPVFCDIDNKTYNIDNNLIEKYITNNTSAILPVHVFGNPCNVSEIESIAKKNDLKVIYDAAHAFGVEYKGESVLKYGDISTLSFHATKLFHTVEGGALITECDVLEKKIRELINFGIIDSNTFLNSGTNAKMNEFEAAMGLCVLDDIEEIKVTRNKIIRLYKNNLKDILQFQEVNEYSSELSSYIPVVFESEESLLNVKLKLEENEIYPRRYFYPSLNEIYTEDTNCIESLSLSKKILCLPLFFELKENDVNKICKIIKEVICD